jgi:broad specificity phosphatase PhoE
VTVNRTLHVVRHAQTAWNRQGRYLSRTDMPLDEEGQQQAELLASYFTGMSLDLVVSSPLQRALATAEAIMAAHPHISSSDLAVDARLRELDFGVLEGRRQDEFPANSPEQIAHRDWRSGRADNPPGGEPWEMLARRLQAAVDDMPRNGTVVAVTHGYAARALLVIVGLGVSAKVARRLHLGPACLATIRWDNEHRPRLVALNASCLSR